MRVSKNCPAQRLELSDDKWKERIYTMLAFCVASHIAVIAVMVASVFK